MADTILNETTEVAPTENTDFTYDEEGHLLQVTAPDGMVTLTRWYLPGEATTVRIVPVTDVTALVSGLTLPDGTALANKGFYASPPLTTAEAPLLQAQFCYLSLPDGSCAEGELTLYGYGEGRSSAEEKVKLLLDGVDVEVQKNGTWQVTLSPGRQAPLVTFTEERVNRSEGETVTRRAETCWYASDAARSHQSLRETTSRLPGNRGWLTTTTASLPTGETVILKQQVTSAFSGLLQRESQQNIEGKPVTFVALNRDFSGQEVSRTIYAWDEEVFLSGDISGLTPQSSLPAPVYRALESGALERTETADGRWLYTVYDCLQRPVSRWLQRVPGSDHTESNRVCLDRQTYGADGRVADSTAYDYLPGGLCEQVISGIRAPAKVEDWFWSAGGEQVLQSSDNKTVASRKTKMTGRMDGTVTGSTVTTQTNLPDGRVLVASESRKGEPNKSALQAQSLQETDRRGNVTRLNETVVTVNGEVQRSWAMTYDDLDRRTSVTAPDGTVVTWNYQGLSEMPVSVTLTEKNGKKRPLGSRTVSGDSTGDVLASLTRGNGAGASTETLTRQGKLMAGGATLFAEVAADDSALTVYSERDGKKTKLAIFRVNPATQTLRSVRLAGPDQQVSVVNESLTPALLGECRLDRLVGNIIARARTMTSLRGRVTAARSASGVSSQRRPSPQGMPTRVRRGELEYRYRWTPEGQCAQATVQDLRTGSQLVVDYAYNSAGNETTRIYCLDGNEVVRWAQTWTAQGQLSTLSLYRYGSEKASRIEAFTYDTQQSGLREELLVWEVSVAEAGTDDVCDRAGRAIRKQTFAYDALGSMMSCETSFADNKTETRMYLYDDAEQPSRRTLETVTDELGTTTSYPLAYDSAGNLTASGDRQFTYTTEGRLGSVMEKGALLTRYNYDAEGALVALLDAVKRETRVLAGDSETFTDAARETTCRRIFDTDAGLVTVVQELCDSKLTSESLYFTLTSPCGGGGDEWWVDESGAWQHRSTAFTPWGESSGLHTDSMVTGLGWNSMTPDPAGLYHLGDGYRAYDPRERTFCQPDSLSPFGAGGLNERAYCAGRDPVNWHDPSGHVMINRFAANEQLTSLDRWIESTAPPPPAKAAEWWEWLILGVAALLTVVAMVASGGTLLAVVPGAIALIGFGVQGMGMAMRQSAPEYAANMELTGSVLAGVGGMLMPMEGIGALTSSLLRTAEAASVMLAVASYALSERNPLLAERLGWTSMGFGLVGVAHSAGRIGKAGVKKIRELRSSVSRTKVSSATRLVDDTFGDISQFKSASLNPAAQLVDDTFGDISQFITPRPESGAPRLAAFGDRAKNFPDIDLVDRVGQATKWHPVSHSNNKSITWGADTEIGSNEIFDAFKDIAARPKSSRPIHVLSAVHGDPWGDNWIQNSAGVITRNPVLNEKKFFQADINLGQNYSDSFSKLGQQRSVFVHDITNASPAFIENLEAKNVHIIYNFCFGRNDERLLHVNNIKHVESRIKTQKVVDELTAMNIVVFP